MMEWFVKFPALFALLGAVVGGIFTAIVAVLIFRKYGNAMVGASDKVAEQLQKQVDIMQSTLDMQKTHYEQAMVDAANALEMQKAHYEREIEEWKTSMKAMTAERNDYRQQLHDVRDDLGAKLTNAMLTIKEMESRPNVDQLFKVESDWHKQREEFYKSMSETQERMSESQSRMSESQVQLVESQKSIIELVNRVDAKLEHESQQHREELKQYASVCQKTAEAMDALVKRLTIDGVIPKKV